ncbi:MAG: MBOAT family protein [Lachnospiraceae bacterium]|nr:MBOAT family protein [Lachnospiraceae bacterium]
MAFFSAAFFGFVIIFLIIHHLAGEMFPRYQWVVRLLAGLSFFTYLSGIKIIFLIASALTVWSGALLIHQVGANGRIYRKSAGLSPEEKKAAKQKCRRTQRAYAAAIVIFNIALLVLVKYFLPVASHPIALPLGISFYSLMAVSYIIDVYGEKYEPQANFGKLLLYLCWFPQLIQGPINRYDLVEKDLYEPFRLHAPEFRYAFYMFLFGAVKKYALADLLAPAVNMCLNNNSQDKPGAYVFFGALLFAIEQYADFSGGIDMSMGISLLFGVRMNENFKQPYFSDSLAAFWRRWHISLGSFMRDYVFYPFVTTKPVSKMTKAVSKKFGAHAGRALTGGISNLIVFVLVGLWHGPQKHYIIWGLYNGLIIAISDALSPLASRINAFLHIREDGKGMHIFRIVRTFLIVVFAGYFDVIGRVRTGAACFINTFLHFDLPKGITMIGELFTGGTVSVQAFSAAALSLVLLVINSVIKERGGSVLEPLTVKRFYLRWIVYFALFGLLLYSFAVSSGIRGFMYAAF